MRTFIFSVALLSAHFVFSQEPEIYLGPYMPFQKGLITYTFQDGAELRDRPDAEGKTMMVLKIGEKVEIDSTVTTNYERPFLFSDYFKVKCKSLTGYMQVKDIAVTNLNVSKYKTNLLFQLPDLDDAARPLLHVKEVSDGVVNNDIYLDLNSDLFQVKMSDPRGLSGIEKLFYIDYISEACGMEGGQSIYSWNPGSLKLIASLTEVSDGGVFYYLEKFTFPADKNGKIGKIIYDSEEMELYDEESEWQSIKNVTRIYSWVDGEISPEFTRDPYEVPEIGVLQETPDEILAPVEEAVPDVQVNEVYSFVEETAQFPGGTDSLYSFIHSNLIYPKEAIEKGISGKVYVQMIVETDGSITNIKVLRSPDAILSDESIRIIKLMPNFIPGKIANIPVRSLLTLPISFKL